MKNSKLVPELRFSGFEGEWKRVPFKNIYDFKTTNSYSRDNLNYENGLIKNIHYGDIHTKFNTQFDITKETVPFVNPDINLDRIQEEHYLKIGDLVIADASEDYNDIGKSIEIINIQNEKIIAGLHTFLARKKSSAMAVGFGSFLMKTYKVRLAIMKIAQGTKVLSISTGRLSDIILTLPHPTEQQKIANFLTKVDARIQLLQDKKSKLERYKKGVMQQIFSQKIRFTQEDGTDFGDWEVRRLGEIAEINPKSTALPKSFIYIDLESVQKGQLVKKEVVNLKNAPSRAQRFLIINDVLFQTVRPYQKNNLLFSFKGAYVASTGYAQLRAKNNPMFLFQLIHTDSFVEKVLNLCTGTSYPSINSSDLSTIKIQIPHYIEQQKIANFLSALDQQIEQVGKQVEQMQMWKKGLLQKMFV